MVELITEKNEWNTILGNIGKYDFYHTYDYHHISKDIGEAPILLHYSEGDKTIALPLLLRSIGDTNYKDVTSVYGYAGPLVKNIGADFDNSEFKAQLNAYFTENKIISVFSRLHPFLPSQQFVLNTIGEVSSVGQIVNVDLTKDLTSQRHAYQSRLKTYINKSRREYTIFKARTETDVIKFISLYEENMKRVKAIPRYFFSHNYYFDLLKSPDFHVDLLLASCNDTQEIVGGALFVKTNNIVQYHLSGVKSEYLHLNPIKMLIDEVRINATHEKLTYFNLGGGIGGKEDTLFDFKAGFSRDFRTFKLWKYVVNEKIYENLIEKAHVSAKKNLPTDQAAYFPHYRCIF